MTEGNSRTDPTTYVAVDPEALRHNVQQVLSVLKPGTRLMAVVKSNAYGHGLLGAARVLLEAGARWLGVSSIPEGVKLREAGIEAPILIFMPALREECEDLVAADLTATVSGVEHITWLHEAAQVTGRRARAHIYIDTGLGRMPSDDSAPDMLDMAEGFGNVDITGVYTHFGPPGSGMMADPLEVLKPGMSLRMFVEMARDLAQREGRRDLLIHVAASALTLENPDSHLDLVRVGTLLYGQYPAQVKTHKLDLRCTFELRSRVVHLGEVGVGGRIGYGGEFHCRRETRIATVPLGYAHGLGLLPLSLAGRRNTFGKAMLRRLGGGMGRSYHALTVTVRGQEAPIVGRIAMDHCMVDVTDLPEVRVGDRVIVPVRRATVNPDLPRVYQPFEEE